MLTYLNDKADVYIDPESFPVAINLYIAKLNELNMISRDLLKGNSFF